MDDRAPLQPASRYDVVEADEDELAAEVALLGGLAASVRELMDASLRTTVGSEVGPQEIRAVIAEIEALTERLRVCEVTGSHGVGITRDGAVRSPGNAVSGFRNPMALPLHVRRVPGSETGEVEAEATFGALHEGPPGFVHGGVLALVLDQLLGGSPVAMGTPGMTGTLTLRYRSPTPLGPVRARAWVARNDGAKTWVHGEIATPDGEVTVRAEALFITPAWAREAVQRRRPPGDA